MKKTVTWVLVADGARARILENTGPGKGLHQVEGLEFSNRDLGALELDSDQTSRTSTTEVDTSSAPRTQPVDHREAEFVKSIVQMLEKKAHGGAFDRLVIAAAPIALGDIRKSISPQVKKLVIAEINKDLTNIPTPQLNQHIDGIIAV
jgi:protein required for attachment to host cells